jgi:hypothetical protein
MSFWDIFIRLGKNGRGAARNIEMIPNTTKPSHHAPIQRGSRGFMSTSVKRERK